MKNNLSYAAGYIDGDGCFYIGKQNNPIKYRARIIISSTNKDVLSSFVDHFGGKVHLTPKRNDTWKRTYHWLLEANESFEFVKQLDELLIEKRGDANLFLEFIKTSCKTRKQELINQMKDHRDEVREITQEVVEEIRNIPFIGVSNELDYPYLAGFIDAECCLGISKYKPKNRPNMTYKISLQCNNANPLIFYWLMERFGGSLTHVRRKHKNPKHRDQAIWNLTGNALFKVLPKIFPYLRTKKPVCEKLIEFHETNLPNGGDRQSEDFQKSYSEVISIREKLVNDIHKLNSKGVNNV